MATFFRQNLGWVTLFFGTVGLPFFSLSSDKVGWTTFAGPYDRADLEVTIADDPDPVLAGPEVNVLTYVISLVNNGPDGTSSIVVNVVLGFPAAGVTIADVVPSSGTWANPSWSIPSLASGAGATLTVLLNVSEEAQDHAEISCGAAVVASAVTDHIPGNNSASESTVIGRVRRIDCSAGQGGDGESWATAYHDLGAALEAAGPGDELWIAQCVYYPDTWTYSDNDVYATFGLTNGVKLLGGFDATEATRGERDPESHRTILSGDIDGNDIVDGLGITASWEDIVGSNAYHLVNATGADSNTVLDGLTLTGGWAAGGGVHDDGAAIDCGGASPTLVNLLVVGNRSTYRGNLNLCSSAVSRSEFISNRADYDAAAIAVDAGSLTLVNCSFQANRAAGAGAIFVQDADLSLTNVLFSGNRSGNGPAMFLAGATDATLTNVTLAGNRNLGSGGAITNQSAGSVVISNSILWGNMNAAGSGTLDASISDAGLGTVNVGFSLVQGSGGSYGWTGGSLVDLGANLDDDPLFSTPVDAAAAPTDEGDYRLELGSPALDNGNNAANSSTEDLDGGLRITNLVIDMGPYEWSAGSLIFADGFESSDTSRWSAAIP